MRTAIIALLIAFPGFARTAATAVGAILQEHPIDAANVEGKNLFERHCAVCHGVGGKGGRGPGLNRSQLAHAPDDAALKSVISDGIPPAMPGNQFFTDDDIANLATYVRSLSKIPPEPMPGDPVRGASVYANGGCSRCHILAGVGGGYGPDLTTIGIQRSASHIREAILKPDATIPEGFLMVEALTADGIKVKGIRLNEDTFSIQIRDGTGRLHSLRKRDLKEFRKLRGQTPMPSYQGLFRDSELDDLVAYLATRGTK